MKDNDVWTLVDPPEEIKPIGYKWIFKRKRGIDGKVENYKAHLVVKDYRQRYSIDYDEIFFPVVMFKFIWIMLVIATYMDYKIWQINVKIVFLNGELQKKCIWYSLRVSHPQMSPKCASFKNLFMDWSKHLGVGTCILIRLSECMVFLGTEKNSVFINR